MADLEDFPRMPCVPLPFAVSHAVMDGTDAEGQPVRMVRVNISMPSGVTVIFLSAAEAQGLGASLIARGEEAASGIVQIKPQLVVPERN